MNDMNIRWREGVVTGEPYFAPCGMRDDRVYHIEGMKVSEQVTIMPPELFRARTPIDGELLTSKLGPLTTGPFDERHVQNQRPERE